MIAGYFMRQMRTIRAKKSWRMLNKNNFTIINKMFDFSLVEVGNYTYGAINVSSSNSISHLKIGHFCSIGNDVTFVLNNEHHSDFISTYPFKAKLIDHKPEAISKGDIVVDDDVWIGNDVRIMSGVHIGQGAIIATGAVVTHDVPPYAVWGGVPARHIKYRFSQGTIARLMKIDYSRIDKSFIELNLNKFYRNPEESDLSWLPLKN